MSLVAAQGLLKAFTPANQEQKRRRDFSLNFCYLLKFCYLVKAFGCGKGLLHWMALMRRKNSHRELKRR
jgi:hypothetical protein